MMRRVRAPSGPSSGAEAQRVQQRDRPRAHREDVADDAADAGRRALVRLDERRMVVRFDLEDRGEAVADVDRAGVLARALQHARPCRRQLLQVDARALVAAVLRPHHREDAELGLGRLALQRPRRCARIRLRVTVLTPFDSLTPARDWRPERRLPARATMTTDSNRTRPSALPSDASQARSGCGISPTTLRASLQMPAMLCDRAVRIGRVGDLAARVAVAEDRRGRAPRARASTVGRRVVVALAVRDRQPQHAAPARARRVNGVSVCSTRTSTCSQWNLRSRLRSIAPGSRPPRAGPGSRCRCRAPGRRRARTPGSPA